MKFNTVKELITYLEDFNENAEILTDISFSWFKPQFQESNEIIDKKSTKGLYIYGEYNPYYEENKNYYKIKDFIIDNYFDKYPELRYCYLYFKDEEGNPAVEYYLKHVNYWDFEKRKEVQLEILKGLSDFCKDNDMMEEYRILSIFITQEVYD